HAVARVGPGDNPKRAQERQVLKICDVKMSYSIRMPEIVRRYPLIILAQRRK
ncbi:MAG: hypothetical protein ACI9MX_003443, partial [Candidatus Aldehydirespiratoraceae bacterium]